MKKTRHVVTMDRSKLAETESEDLYPNEFGSRHTEFTS